MKTRWLAALLALLLALPLAAGAEEEWAGFRGVGWGALEEDIAEQEDRVADSNREIGGLCLDLIYEDVSVSRFEHAQAAYILYDGALVCAGYAIATDNEEDEEYLAEALTERYGRPNGDGRLIFRTIYGLLSPEDENGSILESAPTAWNVNGTGILLYAERGRLVVLYIGIDYLNSMDAEADAAEDIPEVETEGL